MRNDGRRSARFGGFSERMVSLSQSFGWAFRWDWALRQAQRPMEAATGGGSDRWRQRPMGSGIGWGEAGTGGGIV